MPRFHDQARFAVKFAVAIGIAAAASCLVAAALIATAALVVNELQHPLILLAWPVAFILASAVALLVGFFGAYIFLAPFMILAWSLRPGSASMVLAGSAAGLVHTLSGAVLARFGAADLESPLKGILQFGGFALSVSAANDRNPAYFLGLLVCIPLAGAVSGRLAAKFLNGLDMRLPAKGVGSPPWAAPSKRATP